MSLNAPLWRDSNQSPVQIGGVVSRVSKTLTGNNTTTAVPLFRITGVVQVVALYGTVTTTLGTNNTAAYWRLNDQTAQVDISLATGTALSNAAAGSGVLRRNTAASALTLTNSTAGRVTDPVGGSDFSTFTPFIVTAKNGANTDIEFVYTTTETPTSGAIQFFAVWLPVSQSAAVTAQ